MSCLVRLDCILLQYFAYHPVSGGGFFDLFLLLMFPLWRCRPPKHHVISLHIHSCIGRLRSPDECLVFMCALIAFVCLHFRVLDTIPFASLAIDTIFNLS